MGKIYFVLNYQDKQVEESIRMNILMTAIEFPNLNIKIENLPKSFQVFGLDIAFYGVIIAIGMLAGIAMACWIAKKTGQDPNLYMDLALYGIVFGVIGARLYYVAFRWEYYSENPMEIINLRGGGLAIYGAVIAAIPICFAYAKIKKVSFPQVIDTAMYGLITGQIIGRWGNFFNREAFGQAIADDKLTAMRIYFDENYSISQVPEAVKEGMEAMYGKTLSEIGYIQVQPTFLYELLWNIVVLTCMLIFGKHKKFQGEVLLWYLIGYGLGRAVIEGFRTDQLLMPITGWPVSQALSITLVIVGIAIEVIIRKKHCNLKKATD